MRGSELLQKALIANGVSHVFGILGREAEELRFTDPGLRFILTRHEFTAGIACDAYARITGKAQACFSTFGPGATNLATGVASSCLDRSPMIAMSAQIETHDALFNHVHQCIDQVAVMRPMCKYANELTDAKQIASEVTRALTAACTELYGPAYLSLPVDVLASELPDELVDRLLKDAGRATPGALPPIDTRALDEITELLTSARRPICIVGNSVFREDCVAEFRSFVARFSLPVVSSLASKGALPEADLHNIGPVNRYLDGILKQDLIAQSFAETDLVLLLGFDIAEDVKVAMYSTGIKKKIVRLASTPNLAKKLVSTDVDVIASLRPALEYLNAKPASTRANWAAPLSQKIRSLKEDAGTWAYHHYPTIPPAVIVREVREQLGPAGILCSDIGLHKQYAGLLSATSEPNTFLCSNGLGSFGTGMALALGAKLARPDLRVAAIVGDGGFHSNSQDLETLSRYGIPVVIVILKDSAFGLIKHYQIRGENEDLNAVDFLNVDFVKLAEANQCRGVQVTSSRNLSKAIRDAFAANEPTVIEVPVRYQYRF